MGLFNHKKEKDTEKDKTGTFISFILLDTVHLDLALLLKQIKEDWNIDIYDKNVNPVEQSLVFELYGMMVAVSLMPAPIPNDEAVEKAKVSYYWKEGIEKAKNHKAHILVTVLNKNHPLLEAAVLFVKICTSCLNQPNATAIYTSSLFLKPDYYIENAKKTIYRDEFPLMNLISIRTSTEANKKVSGYITGMELFGKKNIEVLDSRHSSDEVFNFLFQIADYVITYDVTLNAGETIGFSAEQKLKISESKGRTLPEKTIKIDF